MDIAEAMREASTEYSLQLTTDDMAEMQTYLSTVLTRHAEGALLHEAAVGELMMLCMLINTGDKQGLNRRIREFIQQENGGNWPSTTGNPSGSGRGNAPEKA